MALLPSGPFAVAACLAILAGMYFLTRRDIPKAYALGTTIMAVFAIQYLALVTTGEGVATELGLQTATFLAGAWWTPLTGIFVHAGFGHIFGNLFLLLTAGPGLEDRIGDRKFLLIFFLAGVLGFGAHVALSFVIPAIVPSGATALGASGAIFGVLTTFAVRYPRLRLPIPLFFTIVYLPAFVVLLVYLAFNLVYLLSDVTGSSTGVAWWGHFAGFLVGLPFAYTLPRTGALDVETGTRGLPDPEKLAPLASTPAEKRIVEKIRQFTPEARTANDSHFAMAWVDKLIHTARCPACGHPFERRGMRLVCKSGETVIELAR